MSNLSRLLGAAARALRDSSSSSSGPDRSQGSGSGNGNGSGTDWRSVVRSAAGKLTGDEPDRRDPGTGTAHGRGPSYGARPASQPGDGRIEYGQPDYGQSDHGQPRQDPAAAGRRGQNAAQPASEADRVALGKYDYLLRTASPEQLEQVHRDAFARLTPAQRELVQARLTEELPAHERPRSGSVDDLALAATRGQTSRPGLMQKVLGGHGSSGRGGRASTFAAGAAAGAGVAALGGVALAVASGAVISSVAGPLLSGAMADGVDFAGLTEGFGLEGFEGLGDLGGLTEGVDGIAQSGGDYLTGLGDQVSGLGEGFQIPGLSDFFER
ncbi:cation-transporting ATPase [Clavibacter sp. MX14-G9D]|uniref:cation-transporting ATPase n=1 Tax=Clavibacter sp. MX14-G9D TaxID=3064656 RepID=UPI00293EC213|nr:cation-transporting ATPase [Clavibacter sp. MX14-G9D]